MHPMNNNGILFFLIIWCLIGSIPRWGMIGSGLWVVGMLVFALFYLRRKKSIPAFSVTYAFPAGLFELGQLHFEGIPLQSVNKKAQLNTIVSDLAKNQKHLESCRSLAIAITIIGGLSGCVSFWQVTLLFLLISILPLGVILLCRLSILSKIKQIDNNRSPELVRRPAFDWQDNGQCHYLARHFSNALEARYALSFLQEWQIKHLIYPEDELLAFIPGETAVRTPSLLHTNARTFGEFIRESVNLRMPESRAEEFGRNTPPELPEEIKKLFKREKGDLQPLDTGKVETYLSNGICRPLFDKVLFVSYWPTREEAEIAWAIRQIVIAQMGRPEEMMVYPNDPMALMDFWDGDSLEDMEFIMGLEEHFKIKIPDSDVQKFFLEFTLQDAVKYIQSKI